MIRRRRRGEINLRKGWVMLALGTASISVAGGQALHSRKPPTDPATSPGIRAVSSGEGARDARTLSAELMALSACYYEFAKAMTALGLDRIRDSRGVLHDWRAELGRKLADQQHADGSWTNPDESREPASSSASTITSLALLTLRQIRP